MKWKISSILLLCLSFLGFIFLSVVRERPTKPLYFTPPVFLKHFSFGYRDFLADLLWLRFIQSADFCSFEKGWPVYGGDIKQCELGWSYRMADLITELSPRFKAPYLFSSIMLSVFTGDKLGADLLLQKGLRKFPNDWRLLFYSAYFYSIEVRQWEKAADYAYRSAQNGGPQWLYEFSKQPKEKAVKMGETIRQDLLQRNLTEEQKKDLKRSPSFRGKEEM